MLPVVRAAGLVASIALLGSCIDFSLSGGPTPRADASGAGAGTGGASGGGAGTDAAAIDAAPVEVHVLVNNLSFTPKEVRIKVGTTVIWDMMDTGTFHFVVEGNPGAGMPRFESPRLDTGTTWSRKFTEPGTYLYFCSNHSTVMRGNRVVVEP